VIDCLTFKDSGLTNEEWDKFVIRANNGTIFHSRKFLDYHQQRKFADHSLVFLKKDQIIALLPATIILSGKEKVFSSHPGSSWGGLVWERLLMNDDAEEICQNIIKNAEKEECNGIEIRLAPIIYQQTPNDYFTFHLFKNGFTYLKRDLTSVIKFTNDSTSLSAYSADNLLRRKAVNKSQRLGVEVIPNSNDWEKFYQLLSSNLMVKSSTPTHTYDELMKLKELFPEQITLWSAYLGKDYIGGICNWEVKPGYWLLFYSCYQQELSSYRILNRLYYEFTDHSHQQGSKYLDFGTSSINMEVNRGLIKFKEQYTAYGVFRDTMYLKL